jgi:hypothetical protein
LFSSLIVENDILNFQINPSIYFLFIFSPFYFDYFYLKKSIKLEFFSISSPFNFFAYHIWSLFFYCYLFYLY